MCGIAGFWSPSHRASDDLALRRMTDTIAHRGPDDWGAWHAADVGPALGHRRLSIVDTSCEGHQPMASSSGRFTIVFNGEIYNFRDLRRELDRGARLAWRGHSDTEVMLAAFEEWGVRGATERFAGMFAFAVWDAQQRALHLVRDRLGIKPLYYGCSRGTLIFGSELKSLRAHPDFGGAIDLQAVGMFLRYDYIPGPNSIYSGIRKLTPGTILTLTSPDDCAEPKAYWSPARAALRGVEHPFHGDRAEAADAVEGLLRQVVGEHMVSDVPLGAFLSGGIDSSTVVAAMQAQSNRPVRTFSVGFEEAAYNEAEHARAVAAHLGTDHTSAYVTPSDLLSVVPMLPSMYDEPFADSSQVPTYLVSALARRHVTVSLSGDGGDEMFGGYGRYGWTERLWARISRVPAAARAASAALIDAVPDVILRGSLYGARTVLPARVRRHAELWRVRLAGDFLAANDEHALYQRVLTHVDPHQALAATARAARPDDYLAYRPSWSRVAPFQSRMMLWDMETYLPDDILVKVDRASMAVGLEARVPLLDHRLVELAWSLPLGLKTGGEPKQPLRDVLARYVPPTLFNRPKMGFSLPIAEWLRGPLRNWVCDLLAPSAVRGAGLLDAAFVARTLREHLSGDMDHAWALWSMVMLHAWLDHTRGETCAR